jgi:hypothetical protein
MVTRPLLRFTLERMAHALGRKRRLHTNEKTYSGPQLFTMPSYLGLFGNTANQQTLYLWRVTRSQKPT